MLNAELTPASSDRLPRSLALRMAQAGNDAFAGVSPQIDNGDEALYADKSGTYTKGILQTGIGLVDLAAYGTFKVALASGNPVDFQNVVLGGGVGGRTQNGPQGGLAFYLKCRDAAQFAVPPAPTLASEAYATELVELYWASLLRDVQFSDYHTNVTAMAAASELSTMPTYAGPKAGGHVTSDLLFRGVGYKEDVGPYVSQFLLLKTDLGALPIVQRYTTNTAVDFMKTTADFLAVQNGATPTAMLTPVAAPLYLHDGRGLAAYTHSDVLYQAYFVAHLVLETLRKGNPHIANPGNPYAPGQPGAATQNGFASMGGPDIAGSLAAVAAEAIKAVWYQKWWVHLRHRPESGGGIVHLMKTGMGGSIQGQVSNTALNSQAVQDSHTATGTWLLPQAFPEGSPMHPAYPTGHGTVAGACITALKFFYNGDFQIPNPMVPNATWTDLVAAPAGTVMDVNGELNKLASNISFGHGIHAGIHWRSDTLTSIQLGEAVALSYLSNQARTYNETFSISLKKYDGSTVTISNP
jgi:hypothetical protein